jgi:hypothetical protein
MTILFALAACGAPSADEEKATPSWDKTLAAKGLKRVHGIYSLDDEKEVSLKYDLFKEAKRSWTAKLNEQATMRAAAQNLQELTMAEANLQSEINNLNKVANGMNGRNMRYVTSAQRGMIQEANMEKNQLQSQLNEVRQQKNYMSKNMPDAAKRKELDQEVAARKNELVVAISEMKQAIDEVKSKYEEVSADPKVRSAIKAAGEGAPVKPKVGPSKAMSQAEQEMIRLAKQLHVPGVASVPHKKQKSKAAQSEE